VTMSTLFPSTVDAYAAALTQYRARRWDNLAVAGLPSTNCPGQPTVSTLNAYDGFITSTHSKIANE